MTGSTAGIGLAAATGLYWEGANVVIKGRTRERVEQAIQKIPAELIPYGMTKTAQLAIVRGVAELGTGTGITIKNVLPGPTESERLAQFVADLARQRGVDHSQVEAEFFQTARPTSLRKRFATVEEVSNMIVYVCSPLASATNGAALRVDGGVVRALV